MILTYKQENFI